VKLFRDKFFHLRVPLDLIGSNTYEIFFSKIGGMNGIERCYDFYDLVNTANTMNCLSNVKYGENGLQFKRVHNKVKNIWVALHPFIDGETLTNLGDYLLVATSLDIIATLKKGLKKA